MTMAWMEILRGVCLEESGQDLIEYALIAALLGLGTIAALKSVSSSAGSVFNAVGTTLQTAT